MTLWLAPAILWVSAAIAQTSACQPTPTPFVQPAGELVTPAYFFPTLPATSERPEFPVALTVWRVPCPLDGTAVLWVRMTPDLSSGRPIVRPRVTVVQDGVEKGSFGTQYLPSGGYNTTGEGFRWFWHQFDMDILRGALTASVFAYVPFDPDRAFTLKLRFTSPRGDYGWTANTPDLVYEIPARGAPGNLATVPDRLAGLWWNPAEPGTALILDRNQRGATYAAWLTYDDNGDSTWFVMTNSRPSADGGVEGAAYTLRGQPFSQPQLDTAFGAEVVGRFHLKFTDASNGEFNYQVNGRSGRMPIQRFEVRKADGTVCNWSRNVQQVDDLIGWGASLEGSPYEAGCALHASFLTYDDAGKPMMVFGGLARIVHGPYDHSVQGALYRPRGTPYGLPYGPSRFVLGQPVGQASSPIGTFPQQVRVDINGVSRTLALSRFYFEY